MTDLSQQSLEEALIQIHSMMDNQGEAIRIKPTKLLVRYDQYKQVMRVLGRRGTRRYHFLQRKGVRPRGCRS